MFAFKLCTVFLLSFLSIGDAFVSPLSRTGVIQRRTTCASSTLEKSNVIDAVKGSRELKDTIVRLSKGTKNGVKASQEAKEKILKAADELSAMNPTADPALSPLHDGLWTLVFTTSDSTSAGKLGPFIGKVQQNIDYEGIDYYNHLDLGWVQAKLRATWKVLNPTQWTVIFQRLRLTFLDFPILERDLAREGTWTFLYLDEDFRVLRAEGTNVGSNLYIMNK